MPLMSDYSLMLYIPQSELLNIETAFIVKTSQVEP